MTVASPHQRTDRLAAIQAALIAFAERYDDAMLRRQADPLLSPIGWHFRHCVFIECYWIREVVQGDASLTRAIRHECIPELAPKDRRGAQLPDRNELFAWAKQEMAGNLRRLGALPAANTGHPLLDGNYLSGFLVNHHAQHLETMAMVATRHSANSLAGDSAERPAVPAGMMETDQPPERFCVVKPGEHFVGTKSGFAFDNETPARCVSLPGFEICERPAGNAAFAGFIADGGYRRRALWSDQGWAWRAQGDVQHPADWRPARDGGWIGLSPAGPVALSPEAAVSGLSRYEAQAFARWARKRLPHEFEWEAAHRAGLLKGVGEVWEWCANPFHPYPGFRPFPYNEYSRPWFDQRHVALRGASQYTWADVKRPGFRNYYLPSVRHIFAGVRLAR